MLQPGGLSSDELESARASAELERQLGYNPATIVVVFTSDRLTIDDPAWREAEDGALAGVRELPEVADVVTSRENARLVAEDRSASYATIALAAEAEQSRSTLAKVQ